MQGQKFLILHRAPHSYEGNKWGIVGGKMEEGESTVEAIIREVYEETGLALNAEAFTKLGMHESVFPDQTWDFHVFQAILPEDLAITLDPQEHIGFLWTKKEEALAKDDLMPGLYTLLTQDFVAPHLH